MMKKLAFTKYHFQCSNEAVSEFDKIGSLQLVAKRVVEQLRTIQIFLTAGRL